MSAEATPPSSEPAKQPPVAWGKMLVLAVILAAIAGGVYYYFLQDSKKYDIVDNSKSLKSFILQFNKDVKLREGLVDADQDGVADTPTDAKLLKSPAELSFITIAGEDHVKMAEAWKPFLETLSKKLGRPVQYMVDYPWPAYGPGNVKLDPIIAPVKELEQQNTLFGEGNLHICAYSTGQVPTAVGALGFVPLFCPANEAGEFGYEMVLIVPAGSSIDSPKGLKGQELTLTSLSSNAGGRAPLVILKEEFGLMQGRDYSYRISGDYLRSVLGVCYGMKAMGEYIAAKDDAERQKALSVSNAPDRLPVAAVANDLLDRFIKEGLVKPEQFKIIYKSKTFPPLCFGVRYDLDPKLRAGIEETFKEFNFKGTPLESRFPGKSKFARVNYKKDWGFVLELDEKLTKLLD